MCGQFINQIRPKVLAEVFALLDAPEYEHLDINFPGGKVLAIVHDGKQRRTQEMVWGLVPASAPDPQQFRKKYHTWNARAETIDTSYAYRMPFRQQRCLIPANAYYVFSGPKGHKVRHRIELKDQAPYAYAGVWETWQKPDQDPMTSCAIITTRPNELVGELDHRMPVILPMEHYETWLDPHQQDPKVLKPFLTSYPAEAMQVT